jgi:FixJ family two-component response regulator
MNSLQVYVVDDDLDVRKGLLSLLESANYPAQGFANGESFLKALASNNNTFFGCAILDLRMPGMDGLSLQRRLAETGCTIPILFLTGHGELPDAVLALRAGAIDFLLKPVNGSLLLQRVAACWEAESARLHVQKQRAELLSGLQRLTGREREILRSALQGIRNGDIAKLLG